MQCIICGQELSDNEKEELKNKNGDSLYICRKCSNDNANTMR